MLRDSIKNGDKNKKQTSPYSIGILSGKESERQKIAKRTESTNNSPLIANNSRKEISTVKIRDFMDSEKVAPPETKRINVIKNK